MLYYSAELVILVLDRPAPSILPIFRVIKWLLSLTRLLKSCALSSFLNCLMRTDFLHPFLLGRTFLVVWVSVHFKWMSTTLSHSDRASVGRVWRQYIENKFVNSRCELLAMGTITVLIEHTFPLFCQTVISVSIVLFVYQ